MNCMTHPDKEVVEGTVWCQECNIVQAALDADSPEDRGD